jgi:hypothetical protein
VGSQAADDDTAPALVDGAVAASLAVGIADTDPDTAHYSHVVVVVAAAAVVVAAAAAVVAAAAAPMTANISLCEPPPPLTTPSSSPHSLRSPDLSLLPTPQTKTASSAIYAALAQTNDASWSC